MKKLTIDARRRAAEKPLLKTSDIERLMDCSRTTAEKIYRQADKIDATELGRNRGTRMVRQSSALRAVGITAEEMREMLGMGGKKA